MLPLSGCLQRSRCWPYKCHIQPGNQTPHFPQVGSGATDGMQLILDSSGSGGRDSSSGGAISAGTLTLPAAERACMHARLHTDSSPLHSCRSRTSVFAGVCLQTAELIDMHLCARCQENIQNPLFPMLAGSSLVGELDIGLPENAGGAELTRTDGPQHHRGSEGGSGGWAGAFAIAAVVLAVLWVCSRAARRRQRRLHARRVRADI